MVYSLNNQIKKEKPTDIRLDTSIEIQFKKLNSFNCFNESTRKDLS